mgnify:CR=1 FL=1
MAPPPGCFSAGCCFQDDGKRPIEKSIAIPVRVHQTQPIRTGQWLPIVSKAPSVSTLGKAPGRS